MAVHSRPIPNLIQGVSQQAAQQRRDAQCEAQFDCLNSPESGAVSRNGLEVFKVYPGLDLTDAWVREVYRGNDHYLYAIKNGQLTVINIDTGVRGTVTYTGTAVAYLANATGYVDRDAYRGQTVDDFTFLAKRNTPPAMSATTSPQRPYEAMFYVREGAYSCDYSITLIMDDGTNLNYTYATPDNSTVQNAPYVATTQIAATLFRAMAGYEATQNNPSIYYPGDTGGTSSTVKAPKLATSNGFSVAIQGDLLRVWRSDGHDFAAFASDGAGGAGIMAYKGTVDSVTDLPKGGFDGFVLGVKGSSSQSQNNSQESADFYVQFQGSSANTGVWNECVKPNTPTSLDASTMPHVIVNTATDTFVVQPQIWSTRICGDGVLSAKDPGFVGKGIEDLFWYSGRLGILTQSTVDFSKARNPFTFFPDTLQAILADAPIEMGMAGSETVAVLTRKLLIDEGLNVWAQRVQFRISEGTNSLFSQDTLKAPETTAYEFSEEANFAKVGATVYFATDNDSYVTIRNLSFSGGKASGDTDVTAHVPAYIPAPAIQLEVSDTGQLMFVRSQATPGTTYLYNYLVEGARVVQSAWNAWRLPPGGSQVVWLGVRKTTLNLLHQRPEGLVFCKLGLNPHLVDAVTGAAYRTRLDYRMDQSQFTLTYTPASDTIPAYTDISGLPITLTATEQAGLICVLSGGDGNVRGKKLPVLSSTGTTVRVRGNLIATNFYLGLMIRSERTDSEFFLRSQEGVQPTDRLQVREYRVLVDQTGYSRIEVQQGQGRLKVYELKPSTLGTGAGIVDSPPVLARDQLVARVDTSSDAAVITLINDSFLPSRWQTAEYRYEATVRALGGASSGQGAAGSTG